MHFLIDPFNQNTISYCNSLCSHPGAIVTYTCQGIWAASLWSRQMCALDVKGVATDGKECHSAFWKSSCWQKRADYGHNSRRYVHVCVNVCAHARLYVCVNVCVHACLYVCVNVCARMRLYVCVRACVFVCFYTLVVNSLCSYQMVFFF